VSGARLHVSRAVLLWTACLTAACGRPLLKLPAGPGTPAGDGATVFAEATAACRAINTITLEMSVRGSANGRRLRGRLTAGLGTPASARLEAVASFGQPLFVFVARNDDASVLLPRDNRILEHGKAEEVLEAVTGVPIGAAALRSLVTGCTRSASRDANGLENFRSLGEAWRVANDESDTVYFQRMTSPGRWRLVATVHPTGPSGIGWRAEYSMFEQNLPRKVDLVSQPPGRFDLELGLSQVELNVALGPEVFQLQQKAAAAPITLDELRQSGPLGQK
jgi:hypothetical protein